MIGGQQREPRSLLTEGQSWYDYKKGVILHVNTETCEVKQVMEYTSPSTACAEGDPVLFKSGTRVGNLLYTCTQTEILIWSLPTWEQVGYVSLPCFNDVHHVTPTAEGNLLIANSGLEMVLEVTPTGQILNEWNVLGEEPWENFSKEIDYRKGISTKPHRAHPNYVFYVGDDIWATRFELKDAICLTRPERSIPLSVERVHDGFEHAGMIYFTAVNGHIIIVDPQTLEITNKIDLNELNSANSLLGWCRGILLEQGQAWVGFSRIRPTKFRETVSWVRQGFQHSMPTRIECIDLARGEKLAEVDLEPFGLNAVFSILPAYETVVPKAVPSEFNLQLSEEMVRV